MFFCLKQTEILFLSLMFFWLNKIHKYTPGVYSGLRSFQDGEHTLPTQQVKSACQNAVLHSGGETALHNTGVKRLLCRLLEEVSSL